MRVILAPDPSLDDATVVVRYGVGSADDPPGKDGLAHFVEHLMFSGTAHVPAYAQMRLIEGAGGWGVNGETRDDTTIYLETVPPERLPLALWLESDRMGFAAGHWTTRDASRERAAMANELRQRVLDQPLGALQFFATAELFPPWHPYHRGFDLSALDDLSLRDARAFVRTWYGPRNATLIVAGKFEPAALMPLIERDFGDLVGAPPPARPTLPATWPTPLVRVDVAADVPRPLVIFAWRAPPLGRPGDAALDLAARILAGPHGRLQRALVTPGLAVSVSADENSAWRGSIFEVSAALARDVKYDDAIRAIEGELHALWRGVSADECEHARRASQATALLGLETSADRARRLARVGGWGLHTHDALQPTDVLRAVRTSLVDASRVVLVVHPDPGAPPYGWPYRRVEMRP